MAPSVSVIYFDFQFIDTVGKAQNGKLSLEPLAEVASGGRSAGLRRNMHAPRMDDYTPDMPEATRLL